VNILNELRSSLPEPFEGPVVDVLFQAIAPRLQRLEDALADLPVNLTVATMPEGWVRWALDQVLGWPVRPVSIYQARRILGRIPFWRKNYAQPGIMEEILQYHLQDSLTTTPPTFSLEVRPFNTSGGFRFGKGRFGKGRFWHRFSRDEIVVTVTNSGSFSVIAQADADTLMRRVTGLLSALLPAMMGFQTWYYFPGTTTLSSGTVRWIDPLLRTVTPPTGPPVVTPPPALLFGRGSFGLVYTHAPGHTVNQATINRVARMQASHIIGFGANDLLPTPNSAFTPSAYDWGAIDSAIVRSQNAIVPQIVLYGAPGWMKGSSTFGNEDRVLTSKFADYAEMCRRVALRYSWCKVFVIWNEMKGFFDNSLNRWGYEDFTTMYNMAHAAIKSVRPDALIGGPYMVLDKYTGTQSHPSNMFGGWGRMDQRVLDAYNYWRMNAVGYDFVSIDFNVNNKDGASPFTDARAVDGVIEFMQWIRQWSSKPIVIQETYLDPLGGTSLQDQRNLWGTLLTRMKNEIAGESVALAWDESGFGPVLDSDLVTVLDNV
jgi:hypothetical protein